MKRLHMGWVLLLGTALFSCTPEETPVPRAKESRLTAPDIALIPVNYQILDTLTTTLPDTAPWIITTSKDFKHEKELNADGSFGHPVTIQNLRIPATPSVEELVLRDDGMSCPDQLLFRLPFWQEQANKQCRAVIGYLPCSIGEKAVTLVIRVFPLGYKIDPEFRHWESGVSEE